MVHWLHLKNGNNFCSQNFHTSINMNNIMNQKKKMVERIHQNRLYRLVPVFVHKTLTTNHNILCSIHGRIWFCIISSYHAILVNTYQSEQNTPAEEAQFRRQCLPEPTSLSIFIIALLSLEWILSNHNSNVILIRGRGLILPESKLFISSRGKEQPCTEFQLSPGNFICLSRTYSLYQHHPHNSVR